MAERVGAFGLVMGGAAHFVARAYFPGVSMERTLRVIELLGEVKRLLGRD